MIFLAIGKSFKTSNKPMPAMNPPAASRNKLFKLIIVESLPSFHVIDKPLESSWKFDLPIFPVKQN